MGYKLEQFLGWELASAEQQNKLVVDILTYRKIADNLFLLPLGLKIFFTALATLRYQTIVLGVSISKNQDLQSSQIVRLTELEERPPSYFTVAT